MVYLPFINDGYCKVLPIMLAACTQDTFCCSPTLQPASSTPPPKPS